MFQDRVQRGYLGKALGCAGVFLMAPAFALAEAAADAIAYLDETPPSLQTTATTAHQPILLVDEGGDRVLVKDIRILRNQRFAESELKPLVAELVGRELGFAEIRIAAGRIGAFYRERGWRARAVLPQQTVRDGIVQIVVIEDDAASARTDSPAQSRAPGREVERIRQKSGKGAASPLPPAKPRVLARADKRKGPPGKAVPDEQHEVGKFFAARYRIDQEAVQPVVTAAFMVGEESSVDPLLILAMIAVESSFNPAATSVHGAKGLMQVIAKFHREKLAPHGDYEGVLHDPFVNIRIGTQILREYLLRFGTLETALQMYGGAVNDPNSAYARKVLEERARIEQLLASLRGAV